MISSSSIASCRPASILIAVIALCPFSAGTPTLAQGPTGIERAAMRWLSSPDRPMAPILTKGGFIKKKRRPVEQSDPTTDTSTTTPSEPAPVSSPDTTTSPSEPAPVSSTSVASLTFVGMEGGSNPADQTLTITNTGGGTLSWTISDDGDWVSVSPTSGTTTTESDLVTVSVNMFGLASGTYTAVLTLSSGSVLARLPVSLEVLPAAPTVSQSPASLTFVGVAGGANPTAQQITLTNKGHGTLNWSVSKNASWLSVTPTAGTTTTETDTITVSVNATGLAANTYTALLTVTDPSASNSPQEIPVTLALTAPQSGTAELTWNANTASDLAGYRVYMGTAPGTYGSPTDVGNVTSHKVVGLLPGTTFYFAVTAYDKSGNESSYSNEVSKSIP
ncbi:BACON domain-containing protein [Candidatus Nitrospira bockiana]